MRVIPATSTNTTNQPSNHPKIRRDSRGSDSCHFNQQQPSNHLWEDVKSFTWEWSLPSYTNKNHITILEKMWRDSRGSDSCHFNQQQPFNHLTILEKMWKDSLEWFLKQPTTTIQPSNQPWENGRRFSWMFLKKPTTTTQPFSHPWEDVKRFTWERSLPFRPSKAGQIFIVEGWGRQNGR